MEGTAKLLFWLIIAFVLFDFLLGRWLNYLNEKNRKINLPDELKDVYDAEEYQRSQKYDHDKSKLGIITSVVGLAAILIMLFLDGFAWLDELVRNKTEHFLWMPLAFFGVLFIASDLFSIPVSLYNNFVIEEKYGFNKMTLKTFITDKLKGYALAIIIGGVVFSLIIWFYQSTGKWFWLYGWITMTVISLFFAKFYTSLIVPIFNKLSPLPEGELKASIESYCQKVNFPLKKLFIIDGSKRSAKANAYFSGMGKSKSIVLFDTLVDNHSVDELTAVIAHEVGHYKKKHIVQSMVLSTIQTGILFYLFGWLIGNPNLSEALGVSQSSFHIGLLAFSLLYSPISMIIGIAMNLFSRKNEYEADSFAKTTYDEKPLKEALIKLSKNNLSNLTPHPAYVFFNYSHPTLLQRLRALG